METEVILEEEFISGTGNVWVVKDANDNHYMNEHGGFSEDIIYADTFNDEDEARDAAEEMGFTVLETI